MALSVSNENDAITKLIGNFRNFVIEKKETSNSTQLSFCTALLTAIEERKYDKLINMIETYGDKNIDQTFRYLFYLKIRTLFKQNQLDFSKTIYKNKSEDGESWKVTCSQIRTYPFEHCIYMLTVANSSLYYISTGRAHISLVNLFSPDINKQIVDIDFMNINRCNCQHVIWNEVIFIFVSREDMKNHCYIINVYGYCLHEDKLICHHSILSNVILNNIFLIVYKNCILFIEKRRYPVIISFSLSITQILHSTEDVITFHIDFDKHRNEEEEEEGGPSRPMLFLYNEKYLILFDANEPSAMWNIYLLTESSTHTGKVSKHGLRKPTFLNEKNKIAVPNTITDEGFLPICDKKQFLCLEYSTDTKNYQIYICSIGTKKETSITFETIDCKVPFIKNKMYSFIPTSSLDHTYYILEWYIERNNFKKYPQMIHKLSLNKTFS